MKVTHFFYIFFQISQILAREKKKKKNKNYFSKLFYIKIYEGQI